MYEREMKENFINDYMRSRVVQRTTLTGMFNRIARYEEALNKDCCEFTKKEILNMFKDMQSRSVNSLLNNNTYLKSYVAWQKHYNGFEKENVYEEISIDDLKPLVDKDASRLLSKEEVSEIEDNLLNWTDKAIFRALYEGLASKSASDLVGIDESMLDRKAKELILPDGRVFELSDELLYYLVKCFEETEYICYGETLRVKRLMGKGRLYKERDNSRGVLDTEDKRFRYIYRKIQVVRSYLGMPHLTMKLIASSGFVNALRDYINETNLGVKEFLQTEQGERLMERYNFNSKFRVDNIIHRYANLI